jgi:hypothetical protein
MTPVSKELENLIKHTVTRKAIIKTGPRLKFLLRVTDWLKSGLPGAIVVADMRFGKTYGTRWVLKTLGVPHIIIPTRSRTKPSEGGFFSNILTSVRHRHAHKGTVDTRRDRVTNYLVALAKQSATNTIIVAFDEAHKLTDVQYQWLLELQNELELHSVTVFFLLVGQQRLEEVRTRLESSGQTEITARFMMDIWRLPGITSLEEVAECFAQFNEIEVEDKRLPHWPRRFGPRFAMSGAAPQLRCQCTI